MKLDTTVCEPGHKNLKTAEGEVLLYFRLYRYDVTSYV
jgi:hypothetical protein